MKNKKRKNSQAKGLREHLKRKDIQSCMSEDALSGAACEYSDEQWERDRIACIANDSF